MENSIFNKIKIGRVLKIYNGFEFNYYMKLFDVDSLVEWFKLDPVELDLD